MAIVRDVPFFGSPNVALPFCHLSMFCGSLRGNGRGQDPEPSAPSPRQYGRRYMRGNGRATRVLFVVSSGHVSIPLITLGCLP